MSADIRGLIRAALFAEAKRRDEEDLHRILHGDGTGNPMGLFAGEMLKPPAPDTMTRQRRRAHDRAVVKATKRAETQKAEVLRIARRHL